MARLNSTRLGRFLMRVALYGGALFVGLPLVFSHVMIRTHRRPTEPPPPRWEETWITSEDLRLRAWLGPEKPGRPAVVVVHGLGDSLESYFPIASVLSGRGHTVLLLDLRGHGASAGSRTTMGGHEREDVRAGMRFLSAQGLARRGVVLFGFSMGAVAVLRAAADREDVRAVVAESPFDTYRDTVAHHARILYGLPRWFPVISLAIAAAEWRAGFDADEVDAVAAAAEMKAPLLLILDGEDPRMPEPVVRRVLDAHPGPKRFWVAEGAPHSGARNISGYWETILAFLEEAGV